MIHTKITNVLLFLLILSLWFLAYLYIEIQIDMQNRVHNLDIKEIRQEILEWKTKQQGDFQPPELEPEPIKLQDFQREEPVVIPGIYVDPRLKVRKHGN